MTLDEAIKYIGERAARQRVQAKSSDNPLKIISCIKSAEENEQIAEWLKELKVLKEERPQGKWIKKQVTPASCTYVCSECGIEEVILGNFCCWCGADMRGAK